MESIHFHNEENGYTIMAVAPEGGGRSFTLLGNLPAVVAGEKVRAEGEWVEDRKWGRQFRASRIAAVAPGTPEGIRRFLASGLIDGIGKTYAKRIVEAFGEDTLEVIENASLKLESVPGIGRERRRKIKESWKRQKSVRDIMLFLHEQGLSTARALRLFRNYGEEAVNVLRANPYQLAHDLPGVGFRTADDIARKMGREPGDPRRLAAGLAYAMEMATRQGHSALPEEELFRRAAEVLGVEDPATLQPVLAEVLSRNELAVDTPDAESPAEPDGAESAGNAPAGTRLVYPPDLLAAEKTVARRIHDLVDRPASFPGIDAPRAIAWFEKLRDFSLGEEQAEAVSGALRHRCFLITGGPGTGKTTILDAVLRILLKKGVDPVLCAPTGRASQRLSESAGGEAKTLHRLLEYQPGGGFLRNARKPLEGELFIVDEASMVDLPLMARFLEALPDRAHLLLVGDVDQLPSVGPGTVLRDLISSGTVPVARLTRIFRQAEASRIVAAAHEVNAGRLPEGAHESDGDFFFLERQGPEAILGTVLQLVTERIPAGFGLDPRDGIQVLTPMNKNSLGAAALNARLQEALNPPDGIKFEIERFGNTFRTGDKVIQTRNNYDLEVHNGDIGHIREITAEPSRVEVVFGGGRTAVYEPGDLDELQPAYAITIHKSQGSEFPAVVVPLASQHHMLLQRNLLYTALTRGKKLVVLVGERKALQQAVSRQESHQRWGALESRVRHADC